MADLRVALKLLHGASRTRFPANLSNVSEYQLHDFVRDFGRSYLPGTDEWTRREETYRANLQQLGRLLSVPSLTWTPGITEYMDYAEGEYASLLGYTGRRSRATDSPATPAHPEAEGPGASLLGRPLPSEFAVANGSLTRRLRKQSGCGSCWAAAAANALDGLLQSNAALLRRVSRGSAAQAPMVSSQTLLSCVENPKRCGRMDQCAGATAELAFDFVKSKGVSLEAGAEGPGGGCDRGASETPRLGIRSFTVLPRNTLHLKHHLFRTGIPIVVSVDATNWRLYVSGIFRDTDYGEGDFTVNHAVVLMGYKDGGASSLGYWLLKNSWGAAFGEQGHIRIEMKRDEESHCGWDEDTHLGVACFGEPDRAWACGTCGILYDATYPMDAFLME